MFIYSFNLFHTV